jgi:hypothetical protein
MNIFLFSYETTSTTMQFCLYELSKNKEIQEKARQDVENAIKKHGEMTYEALSDMKYLEQCVEGENKLKLLIVLNHLTFSQRVYDCGRQFPKSIAFALKLTKFQTLML